MRRPRLIVEKTKSYAMVLLAVPRRAYQNPELGPMKRDFLFGLTVDRKHDRYEAAISFPFVTIEVYL